MRSHPLILPVTILTILLFAAPVAAGNWASVTLDAPPSSAVVGRPWHVGFTVKQHDVRPTNEVTPRLTARHRESGETVDATARQQGEVGHFIAEATLPAAGEWTWNIVPQPFPGVELPPLTVVSGEVGLTFSPFDDDPAAAVGAGTADATGSEGNVGRKGHEVGMTASSFSPAALSIGRGEAVVWRNDDAVSHDVAWSDPAVGDSGLIGPGELWVQVFDQAGSFEYHCGPHPGMTGTITVR